MERRTRKTEPTKTKVTRQFSVEPAIRQLAAMHARNRPVAFLVLREWQVTQQFASSVARARPARSLLTRYLRYGKTRARRGASENKGVALAAVAETGLPTTVLCPTKVLAVAWMEELSRHFPDERIGRIGDGQRSIERITVLTFESAYQHTGFAPHRRDSSRSGAILVGAS